MSAASSSLVDQLATKLMQMQKKSSEIASAKSRQARIAADQLAQHSKNEAILTDCIKIGAMLEKLIERNTELNGQLSAKQAEQDAARKQVQEEMKAMMEKVSADVDRAHKEFEEATIENSSIRQQLEALAMTIENGESKLETIMNQGADERAVLLSKGEDAEKESEELAKKLEELNAPVEEARKQHDELRGTLDAFVKRSAQLQAEISDVSDKLTQQRQKNESLAAKEKKLDNELRHELPKVDKVRAEYKQLTAEAAALEAQKDQLESQMKKLQSLCDTLAGGTGAAAVAE